jgi:hypothetical protein
MLNLSVKKHSYLPCNKRNDTTNYHGHNINSDVKTLSLNADKLSRVRGFVMNITGCGLDDWIYWHFCNNYT